MADDDASFAEMRRRPSHHDADPLALDEDTVEQLLTGALPAAEAPAAYTKVAHLLAAATAAPTPEELAGQEAALAELRAVARARPAATVPPVPARPPRRRRRTGLAVVVVVGALVAGGAAGAATGHLPGPVRGAARSILGTGGGDAPASTEAGQPPAPVERPTGAGGGLPGSRPGGTTGTGPAASPSLEGLCQAFVSGNGTEAGGRLEATAFEALARAAGGLDRVPAYCDDLQPGDQKAKEPKAKQPETPEPSGNGGQGQGVPPTSTGSTGSGGQGQGNQGQGGPPDPSSPSPSSNR
jgi:hypothetical protein